MKKFLPVFIIFVVTLFAFFPIFFGKIPLNSRNLVAFFTPWYYEKFPGFPAGVPSKPGMLDQIRLYYPYMSLTQRSYQHGELPLWNPYNFAGNPHMAEWQSGVFYPLHLLLPLLPLPVYWSLFQITGFFFAGYFTYLYLGNIGLRKLSSVFGGLTFMLSSFMTTWNMEVVTAPHSILWLPLLLLSIDKIVGSRHEARSAKFQKAAATCDELRATSVWWVIGLLSLVFSILAGYWQTTLYVMVISALYILYRWFFGRTLIPTKSESAGTPEPRTRALATHGLASLELRRSGRRPWEQVSVVWGLFLWFPLSLALTSFHLLPTWELFERSSRPAVNSSSEIQQILISYLLPLRHVVTLFAPDYFGHPTTRNYFANVGGGTYYEHALFVGTIPLLLSLFAVLYGIKKRDKDIIFWSILAVLAGSFSFKTPWARFVYDLHIPVLSTGIANRILFIPAFALAVLSGKGLEYVKEKSAKKIMSREIGIFALLVGSLFIVTRFTRSGLGAETSIRNMVIPGIVFVSGSLLLLIGISRRRLLNTVLVVIFLVSVAQTLYQHHKFTAFSELELTYPLHPTIQWLKANGGINRFIGYNGQFLNNDFATFFQIYTVEGYDSLNDFRRSLLLHSAGTGSVNVAPPRSADASLGADLSNPRILRLMQIFGIKYLVDHPEWLDVGPTKGLPRLPETNQKLVFERGDWKIWEYLDALPRAYLVGGYEVIPDGQSAIDRLYDASFDPGTSVLLNKPLPAGFSIQPDKLAKVTVVSYTPMKIIFETRSDTDQILFLSDTWYPGWRARLENNRTLPVLAADYALRAVPIPAGNHTVTMWYFPDSFRNGLIISLIAFITVITFIKFITFNHEET